MTAVQSQFPSLAISQCEDRALTEDEIYVQAITQLDQRTHPNTRYALRQALGSFKGWLGSQVKVLRARGVDVAKQVDILREALLVMDTASFQTMDAADQQNAGLRLATIGEAKPENGSSYWTPTKCYRISGSFEVTDADVIRSKGKAVKGVHTVDVVTGGFNPLSARVRASVMLYPRIYKLTSELHQLTIEELVTPEATSCTIN